MLGQFHLGPKACQICCGDPRQFAGTDGHGLKSDNLPAFPRHARCERRQRHSDFVCSLGRFRLFTLGNRFGRQPVGRLGDRGCPACIRPPPESNRIGRPVFLAQSLFRFVARTRQPQAVAPCHSMRNTSFISDRVLAELCSEMEPRLLLITDWYVQPNCPAQPRQNSTFRLEPASQRAF